MIPYQNILAKGKTVSAWNRGDGGKREGAGGKGGGGRNDPNIVCIYE
jgi:hypothetical protein